jgi:hypothetical protein
LAALVHVTTSSGVSPPTLPVLVVEVVQMEMDLTELRMKHLMKGPEEGGREGCVPVKRPCVNSGTLHPPALSDYVVFQLRGWYVKVKRG